MGNISIIKKIFLFLVLFLGIFLGVSNSWADENVLVELLSDKEVYYVNENINLTLRISNLYEEVLQGQIRGKVIVGDVGYEVECFDYNALGSETQFLGLTPLPASLSNSNRKTMTTLYACGGTQMQSSRSVMDSSPISQSDEEVFELGPFVYSYSINEKEYNVESNILNITVVNSQRENDEEQQSLDNGEDNSQEQSQQQQSQSQQSSQEQSSQQGGSSQSGQSTENSLNGQSSQNNNDNNNEQNNQNNQVQNGQSLSQQGQQSLANNQQNAQSVSQLKQDIANAKSDSIIDDSINEEEGSFWMWFVLIFVIVLVIFLIYLRYFVKYEVREESVVKEDEIPDYVMLLNKVSSVEDDKEKAKLLSQAIKTYIAKSNNLDSDLTHSRAIGLTQVKLFQDILKKTEGIEFADKKIKLDYKILVSRVEEEFRK